MAANVLLLNQLVDICGDVDDGFPGSWCEAIVSELRGKHEVLVQYLEFVDENSGHPLRETVLRTRLRPSPPISLAHFTSMKDVHLGHTVEAYHEDCWWIGAVVFIATAGVQVNLHESDGNTIFVRDHRLLRPRVELVKGSWRRVVPSRGQLRKLGLSAKEADAAVRDMEAAPAVAEGTPRMQSTRAALASQPPPLPSQTGKPLLHRLSPWRKRPGGHTAAATTTAGDHAADAPASGPSGSGIDTARIQGQKEEGPHQGPGGGAGKCGGVKRRLEELDAAADEVVVKEAQGGKVQEAQRRQQGGPAPRGSGGGAEQEGESSEDDSSEESSGEEEEAAEETKRQKGGAGESTGPSSAAAAPGGRLLRPRRDGKSRLVYIDGIPVLKANMYGLHDEDTMVWQRGLQNGEADLEGIKFQAPPPRTVRPAQAAKVPRQHPPDYFARQEHNISIRRDIQACEVPRARYLLEHMDKIRPFISAQVEAHICKAATSPAPAAEPPPPVTQQPDEILAVLREYQLEGLSWMVAQYDRGVNAILADEMGLGKTLQTITFLAHLKFVRRVEGPHLVVVPLSVLSSWMSEFKKWCPAMRVVRLHSGDVDERKRLVRDVLGNPSSFDVAVTTYEMVNSQHFGHSLKRTLVWRYLVLDEGHKVKNEESRVSDGMRHVSRQQVLLLTGTPIQNNLHELFALLNFMYPDVFNDPARFDAAFNLQNHTVDKQQLEAAHYLLRPFMLRRLKEEVEVSLPPKLETRIHCPLAHMQTFWYRRLLLREGRMLQQMEAADKQAPKRVDASGEGDAAWKKAMNLLMQLRKVCNHPFMFPDAEPGFDGETAPEELITGSGKMMVLDRMLARLKERGHRVVLFSQFTIMLDIIEDYLTERGYTFRRLDGSTNRIKRMIDMEQFNKPNSDIFIYILCTRAGGLGVNLQTADTCILFDSDWNPQWDLQAMARVHRIGQTRPVHVYRLVTGGTVEDRIQRRAESKLYLDQMVNRGSTSNAEQLEGLHLHEVLSMLKFGADRIFRNDEGAMPSGQELDAIMDRSRMVADAAAALETRQAAAAAAACAGADTGRPGKAADAVKKPKPAASAATAATAAATVKEPAPAAAAARASSSPEEVELNGTVSAKAAVEEAGAAGVVGDRRGSSEGTGGSSSSGDEAGGDDALGTSAGSRGGGAAAAGGGALVASKHTALDFDAEAPVVDTCMFQGQDFRAMRNAGGATLRDIASQYWADKKRSRRERLVEIDGYMVLRDNNYTMEEGMLHHPDQKRGLATASCRRKAQRAGIDYDHTDFCLICWDGGDLLCCDHCPAAFHPECVGISASGMRAMANRRWVCPHHECTKCQRNTSKAGGLLFRCEMCENAFCEDDLPADYHMVGECELFKALGQRHPKPACFIHCSNRCKELSAELQTLIKRAMAVAAARGAPGEDEEKEEEGEESSEEEEEEEKEEEEEEAKPPAKASGGRARGGAAVARKGQAQRAKAAKAASPGRRKAQGAQKAAPAPAKKKK